MQRLISPPLFEMGGVQIRWLIFVEPLINSVQQSHYTWCCAHMLRSL